MRPDSMNQYQDLPQIPSNSMEESAYHYWPHEQVAPMYSYSQRAPNVYRGDYLNGSFIENETTGISMQRYLHGPDPYPDPLLHAKLEARMPLQSQHPTRFEPPFPSTEPLCYSRNDSPETSAGSSSYVAPNELRSPHPFSQVSYGSTSEFIDPVLEYPSPKGSFDGAYPSELTLQGGTICPRDTEHFHEAENTTEEHDCVDEKPALDYDHYPQLETAPETYKGYDRSIGTSVRDAEEVQPITPYTESAQAITPPAEESDSDWDPRKPNKRRSSNSSQSSGNKANQKRRSRKTSTATAGPSRVNKKSRGPNASPNTSKSTSGTNANRSEIDRPFICLLAAYGCQSSFTSKNEWKRHIATQHIKRGFWRCDLCPSEIDAQDEGTVYHNDFNRKDLFTQHLRRMHAAPANAPSPKEDYEVNEDNITEHQLRCYELIRATPPQSVCLFCDRTFQGPSSWEERLEHVGKHFEKDRSPDQLDARTWKQDKALERWLYEEGLIAPDRNSRYKIGDGKPNRNVVMESDDDDE